MSISDLGLRGDGSREPDVEKSQETCTTDSDLVTGVGPRVNSNGHVVHRHIHPDGESGRAWAHPWHFARIIYRSSSDASKAVNILWLFVPPAIALHFIYPDSHSKTVFALNYIAMVPTANLIGFAGQELARKLPKVFGEGRNGTSKRFKPSNILQASSWKHFLAA